MKRLFLLTTTIFLFAAQMYAQNGKLIVRFENLKNNDGKVMVALFDGKESFSKHESTQTAALSIENNTALYGRSYHSLDSPSQIKAVKPF
jgi:uncharacterized protein (DUF2141 family)